MKRGNKAISIFEISLIILFLVLVAEVLFCYPVSEGKRSGVVTKLSHKGVVCKTWEGDLLMGGQGTVTAAHWNFTLRGNPVAEQINKAMDEQDLVELQYKQYLYVLPWSGDTTYFVDQVKLIHKPVVAPAPRSLLETKK